MSIAHVVDLTLPGFGHYLFGQVIMFRVLKMFTTYGPSDSTQVPEHS